MARAAERSGDKQAAMENYLKLLEQWKHADPDLPERLEAENYLKTAR
jgi:hypothetical protein